MSYVASTNVSDFGVEASKAFKGKTITSIDTSAQNVIYFTFSDGTIYSLFSECSYRGIPFFMLSKEG